jgi:hypothetical protein
MKYGATAPMMTKPKKQRKTMKTTLLASTALLLTLSQSGMAEENNKLFAYQIGYSSNSVQANSITRPDEAGVYVNVDFMGVNSSGFGLGAGFDINAWNGSAYGHGGNSQEYTMAGTLKAGYTFQNQFNIPLKLKAGVGYGYMRNIVDSGWGMHYEGGGEFLIYKNLGLGAKYKYAEADMMGTTIKNDSTIFFMMFGY